MNLWDFVMLAIVVLPTLAWAASFFAVLATVRSMPDLAGVALPEDWEPPTLTIIIPACNEEQTVDATLEALLEARYDNIRIIAVNDRSTDGTGARLDRWADEDDRVEVVHIDELPDEWLGKVHAMHRGVEASISPWVLFCDADVKFERSALERLVYFAEQEKADLVSGIPRVLSAGPLGDSVLNVFATTGFLGGKLWQVPDPDKEPYGAFGAFMLLRREFLVNETPGISWLKLEVADDVGIGLLVKKHGGRCRLVNACHVINLRWYRSFSEMKSKLQKNCFGIVGRFSVARSLVVAAALAWLGLFPLAAFLPLSHSELLAFPAAGYLTMVIAVFTYAASYGRPVVNAIIAPVGMLAAAWLMVRSAIVGLRVGGIRWRTTTYPSSLLRANQRVKL